MWKNLKYPSEKYTDRFEYVEKVKYLKRGCAVTLPFLSLCAVGYYLSKETSVCWKCDMKLPTIPLCPPINLAVSQPPRVAG